MPGQGLVCAVAEEGGDEDLVRMVRVAGRESSQVQIVDLILIGALKRQFQKKII